MDTSNETRALARKRRQRRARQRLWLALGIVLLAAVVVLGILLLGGKGTDTPSTTGTQAESTSAQTTGAPGSTGQADTGSGSTETPQTETQAAPEDDSWKLILVNADHPLPEGYTVTLKALRNGHYVDERIYPELQQMFDDARAQGIYPFINESYRTAERQQQIMDSYIARYENQGMSHDAAVAKALTVVAVPGTSEHQMGLALDIIAEYDSDSSATWTWLKNNSWRYGFILRYPADKEAITGISFEPWHFRYVGVPTAQEITEKGLCLEEYLEKLEK